MRKNVGQKSVDMGLRPDKNMGGWVVFFISSPHIPVTFRDKCPPPGTGGGSELEKSDEPLDIMKHDLADP